MTFGFARLLGAIGGGLIGGLALLTASSGPGLAASPDQAPAVPPNLSRVWFLHQLLPGTDTYAPMLYANGTPIAIIPQGTTYYHDLTPGTYTFTVENCIPGTYGSQTLPLSPGNQIVLQVQDNDFAAYCGAVFDLTMPAAEAIGWLFRPLAYLGPR